MDNNRKTMNKREIFMGHAYVFLFFFLTTVACCLVIFMWNSDFKMFEQKEFVKIKMNRIKDFQQEQAESQLPVDSLFRKIETFEPGVYAQYEEDDIHYLINNLRNTYERNSWDKRYKLFMHIADFYAMWLSDRKQLWSIGQNISLFKANLEECEIGLQKRRKTCAQELKQMIWENLYQKDSVRNRSHAAVHPCRHTDPAVLFQPHRAYDTDPHRGGNRRNGPLCRQHPQRTLLALGIRQRGHITRTERRIRVQETGTLPSTPSSGRRTGKETDHHSTQEPG